MNNYCVKIDHDIYSVTQVVFLSILCSLSSAIDDYKDVLSEVTDLREIAEKLGIALGLSVGTFGTTLENVIKVWLKQDYNTERHGLPSYQQLATAVASRVGPSNPALAKKIAKNHPGEFDIQIPIHTHTNNTDTTHHMSLSVIMNCFLSVYLLL